MSPEKTAKELISDLEKEEDRKKVSLYLSEHIFEKFKKVCGRASASRVMEKLMERFIESVKSGRNLDV